MKVTGDSRFLEGIVDGDIIKLSSFIGSTPVLYMGKLEAGGGINGTMESARGSVRFSAIPNEAAELPDAYTLTSIRDNKGQFTFEFPGLSGKRISLGDEKYRNKVVVITIGGTWCPNCMDEAAFLAPWYRSNRSRGVEIISLQYERSIDSNYLDQVVNRFRKRFGIEYDIAIGGLASKQKVMESLPALDTFISFPTTIILDRKGKVAKIHTGFTGPATGRYYEEFKLEFDDTITRLLEEAGVKHKSTNRVIHPDMNVETH
jgi:thiol-disulfide isomerase/thioredoxin